MKIALTCSNVFVSNYVLSSNTASEEILAEPMARTFEKKSAKPWNAMRYTILQCF
jgi:hypothetical protein